MALSKQYFTILQLLRTARQQVDVNFAEWKVFCEDAAESEDHVEMSVFLHDLVPSGVAPKEWFKCWQSQIDKVTELLKAHSEHLKGRIDRKTEEVESLRDGVRLTTLSFCIRFLNSQVYNDTDEGCLVIQCNFTPRSDERHSSKPCNLCIHGCHSYIHAAWVYGCKYVHLIDRAITKEPCRHYGHCPS